jgi:hypothetical protein
MGLYTFVKLNVDNIALVADIAHCIELCYPYSTEGMLYCLYNIKEMLYCLYNIEGMPYSLHFVERSYHINILL